MSKFDDIKEKICDDIDKQLKGGNGGILVFAGILVAGLGFGLKTIAESLAPYLAGNDKAIGSDIDKSNVDNIHDIDE